MVSENGSAPGNGAPTDTYGMAVRNIQRMNSVDGGYEAVIVCTSNADQEVWWQARLEAVRGQIMPKDTIVLAVHEDWDGGAGNALGTLYAYQKAVKKAEALGVDLDDKLRSGVAAVGMYHTAGKGTRLAPLPGAENNNKPGVRLPAILRVDGHDVNMTILESVIKQTGVYAPSRRGRLSVFWGDQVFIPCVSPEYDASSPADILCKLGPMMSKQEWEERGMDKYGLIAVNSEGSAAQVEKVDYDSAVKLTAALGEVTKVGVSLGSFSISNDFLFALLDEFATELAAKTGKLDSDPHLWMPLTLGKDNYASIMQKKGTSEQNAVAHFDRMEQFKTTYEAKHNGGKPMSFLGAVDVGTSCYWWDYGQVKLYVDNNLRIRDSDEEAEMMRTFFDVKISRSDDVMSQGSVQQSVKEAKDRKSTVVRSVLSNVRTEELHVEDSLLVGVTAKSVRGKGCLLYNVVDDGEVVLPDNTVRADVFLPDGRKISMLTTLGVDSGKNWKVTLDGNTHSFEDVYKLNQGIDVVKALEKARAAHDQVTATLAIEAANGC